MDDKKIKRKYTKRAIAPASNIQANAIHEGAQRYYQKIRQSEIVYDYNKDVQELVSDKDRLTLVTKSRFFTENVPCIASAINDIANYSIGEAWNPIAQTLDEKWNKQANDTITNWYNYCNTFGDDFHTTWEIIIKRMIVDGDIGIQLTQAASGYPQINLIPSHRIKTVDDVIRGGAFAGYECIDGVIYNDNKVGIGYNIVVNDTSSIQLSTQDMILVKNPSYDHQGRGYPAVASGLELWASMREITNSEIEGIKALSAFAFVEYNQAGGINSSDLQFGNVSTSSYGNGQPMYEKQYRAGMVRLFGSDNPNSKLEPVPNNRPGLNTQEFIKQNILKPAFLGLGWSMELSMNLEGLNSANTRTILQKCDKRIQKTQAIMFRVWKRIIAWVIAKNIKQGLLPKNNEFFKFTCTYPPRISIDLSRDSAANLNLLKLAGTNLTAMYSEQGESFEPQMKLRISEVKQMMDECEKQGVPFQYVYSAFPNMQTPPVESTNGNNALPLDNNNANN